jgi:hypothetical protein
MTSSSKMALGSLLAVIGGLGMILGPTVGATALPTPWGFISGFAVGLAGGIGVALAIFGLLEHRQGR